LRDGPTADRVEAIGIARSQQAMAEADIVLWLGEAADIPQDALLVAARCDLAPGRPGLGVSVVTGAGMGALRAQIVSAARALLPHPGALALNLRHRQIVRDVAGWIDEAVHSDDLLVRAELLRLARTRLDGLTGRSGVESMLDALFGGFCIGK
jgi:tRNA modification GTPase